MDRVGKPDTIVNEFIGEVMDVSKNNLAGIDVSAYTLDLVIRKKGKNSTVKRFTNTPEGHASLVDWLMKHQVSHVMHGGNGYLSP